MAYREWGCVSVCARERTGVDVKKQYYIYIVKNGALFQTSPTEIGLFHLGMMGAVAQERTMGWLRLVGSIKLQVSFAEYRLFYRALLQKSSIILSILLTEATPYSADMQLSSCCQ